MAFLIPFKIDSPPPESILNLYEKEEQEPFETQRTPQETILLQKLGVGILRGVLELDQLSKYHNLAAKKQIPRKQHSGQSDVYVGQEQGKSINTLTESNIPRMESLLESKDRGHGDSDDHSRAPDVEEFLF